MTASCYLRSVFFLHEAHVGSQICTLRLQAQIHLVFFSFQVLELKQIGLPPMVRLSVKTHEEGKFVFVSVVLIFLFGSSADLKLSPHLGFS